MSNPYLQTIPRMDRNKICMCTWQVRQVIHQIKLKAYFKKESLVQEVFNHYMKENYFTRAGLDQSSFNLNVASCRLVLDILPGLEIGVLNDTDGLISQLYKWVSGQQEPLCSYATGLLAVAMELNEVATEAEIREKNSKLVPEMLIRLRELQDKAEKERDQARSDRFKRPFVWSTYEYT